MVKALAAARTALGASNGPEAPAVATWHWDLATGRISWNQGLQPLFGYPDKMTSAAWREDRIHPEDRDRVRASLQRATIENHGTVWSDQHRFRRADGSYAAVTERAYVLSDESGPLGVLGALRPR